MTDTMPTTMANRIEAVKRNQELYKALLAADLPVVEKTKTARIQTNNGPAYTYTYADLAAIDQQVTPVLRDNDLLMDFEMHDAPDGTPILTGMLIHPESGGFKTSEWKVTGRTPQDQGGSITYGRRYLTGILTGVITDEDTDGRQANPGAPAAAPKRQPKPSNPATPKQLEQLAQATANGIDLKPIMLQTIERIAGQRTITEDEATKVLQAAAAQS
jgi:ERF superfamily